MRKYRFQLINAEWIKKQISAEFNSYRIHKLAPPVIYQKMTIPTTYIQHLQENKQDKDG